MAQQLLFDPFHLPMQHDDLRLIRGESLIEGLHPHLCLHRLFSHQFPHHLHRFRIHLHAARFPVGPIDRERSPLAFPGQNLCRSRMRKGIQIGIGPCIVYISHAT